MRILGIDYGKKRVGLALSDERQKIAMPLAILENGKALLPAIVRIAGERGVGKIVVGESKDFAGTPNPLMKAIGEFKKNLEEVTALPVMYEPEFMTSSEAARRPGKFPKSRALQRRVALDAKAATIILQSYLDKQSA